MKSPTTLLAFLLANSVCVSSGAFAASKKTSTGRVEIAPEKYLQIIAHSPRGSNDPLTLASRVPITFKQDGHVLVTDTDCEPYPSRFFITEGSEKNPYQQNDLHQKLKEDLFYANRICHQAVGLSEIEIENWLGKPFPRPNRYFRKGKSIPLVTAYSLGGGRIGMWLSFQNGKCTAAAPAFTWNQGPGKELEKYPTSFFKGKTESELFALFGDRLSIDKQSIKSLSEFPQATTAPYILNVYDKRLIMLDHKCTEGFDESTLWRFIKGKTDSELFAIFGHRLTKNGTPVLSAEEVTSESKPFELGLNDMTLPFTDHKCGSITGRLTFGDTFEVYKRPRGNQ